MGEEALVVGDEGDGWERYREVGRGGWRKRMKKGEDGDAVARHLAEQ